MDMKEMICPNCGGHLDINEAMNGVISCKFCQSIFTIAKEETSEEAKKQISFGNNYLNQGKFNEAKIAFQKALEEDNNEPEEYFGLALAEFKVQYLKDTIQNRMQPICYEITNKKFKENKNYLKALDYATEEQRKVYIEKAEEIDHIRDYFYELSNKGKDYDCFLCVKVTTEEGRHTSDYLIAEDIYFDLKKRGYHPFFSEYELKNQAGAEYEANILYALYQSECMLVVCSNEEYLDTPWVRNEYTRFLKMVDDEEKEKDSITIVFNNHPIEKLEGKKGKIQGIDYGMRNSLDLIKEFVENHTPEAKLRREKELKEKEGKQKELEETLENIKKEQDELKRKQESQRNNYVPEEKEFEIKGRTLYKYIGSSANVVIPDIVEKIDENAFKECEFVESITISSNVKFIGENTFKYLPSLKKVDYKGTISQWISIDLNGGDSNPLSMKKLYINGRLFKEENIVLEGITNIRDYAFKDCGFIKSIIIPNSVTSIGTCAFRNCTSLKDVTFDKDSKLKSIGVVAFGDCTSIQSIKIPNNVTNIGENAFSGCTSLKNLTLPFINKNLGYYFYDHGLGDDIPTSLKIVTVLGGKSIPNNAFDGCRSIESIIIPNSVTSIGTLAFWGCTSIQSIKIPNNVTNIGESAFRNCTSLKNVFFENDSKLGSIGSCAFCSCTSLQNIKIPNSVTSINYAAFEDCISLQSIVIPDSVTNIGDNAFDGCSLLKIYCECKKKSSKNWGKYWDKIKYRLILNKRAEVYWKGQWEYVNGIPTKKIKEKLK